MPRFSCACHLPACLLAAWFVNCVPPHFLTAAASSATRLLRRYITAAAVLLPATAVCAHFTCSRLLLHFCWLFAPVGSTRRMTARWRIFLNISRRIGLNINIELSSPHAVAFYAPASATFAPFAHNACLRDCRSGRVGGGRNTRILRMPLYAAALLQSGARRRRTAGTLRVGRGGRWRALRGVRRLSPPHCCSHNIHAFALVAARVGNDSVAFMGMRDVGGFGKTHARWRLFVRRFYCLAYLSPLLVARRAADVSGVGSDDGGADGRYLRRIVSGGCNVACVLRLGNRLRSAYHLRIAASGAVDALAM
jgi:hypothetical protein